MATVVTKSFKIKTGENSFSDPINFLSTSVYLPSGKNLDTHLEDVETAINTEIQNLKNADTALGSRINDEIKDRQDADTALGKRIDALNTSLTNNISTLTGLITAETKARGDADKDINTNIQTLTDNLNTDISQINTNISTLQTTVNKNQTNISSLEVFIKGENQIEENTPCLVDQVAANATKAQENYDAIEALKAPVNANTTKAKENYEAIEALKTLVGASSLEEGASSILDIINSLESRIFILEGLVLTTPDEPGEEGPVEPETPEGEEPIE